MSKISKISIFYFFCTYRVVPTKSEVAPVDGRVAPTNIELTSSGDWVNKTSSSPDPGSDTSPGAPSIWEGADSIGLSSDTELEFVPLLKVTSGIFTCN